jgi:ABC-type lipoprotein export system ATPase subunit
MSILEQVILPLAYQGISKEDREERAINALKKV